MGARKEARLRRNLTSTVKEVHVLHALVRTVSENHLTGDQRTSLARDLC